MNQVVYIDIFFFWNFVMDFVSLLLAGLILGERAKTGRLFFASLFGAGFACAALFLPVSRIFEFVFGGAVFLPMVMIAYGRLSRKRMVKLFGTTFSAALFLSGAVLFLSYYGGKSRAGLTFGVFLIALFFAAGGFFLWGDLLRKKMESLVVSLSVCHGEKEESFYGLVDSGAFLREPESGSPVILMKAEYAASLLSKQEIESLRTGTGEGIFPIPIRTASGEGCLYAFRPRSVRMHRARKKKKRKQEAVMVALDFSGGGFGGCPCLVPLSAV